MKKISLITFLVLHLEGQSHTFTYIWFLRAVFEFWVLFIPNFLSWIRWAGFLGLWSRSLLHPSRSEGVPPSLFHPGVRDAHPPWCAGKDSGVLDCKMVFAEWIGNRKNGMNAEMRSKSTLAMRPVSRVSPTYSHIFDFWELLLSSDSCLCRTL